MYPGADEVGCVLLARLLNEAAGKQPSFQAITLIPGGENIVAAFEDGPIGTTIARQIRAAGGCLSPADADITLYVNPPLSPDAEWVRPYTPQEAAERFPHLGAGIAGIKHALARRERVAVADVAHSNGADGELFRRLQREISLSELTAYAAWNTAGNTIGTVIAAACAALHSGQGIPRLEFLAHRLLEDWAYQSIVREEVRGWLEATTGRDEPSSETVEATQIWIEKRLHTLWETLPEFDRIELVPGSVRLPWQRTFEVDFQVRTR
jgi:hypothetical protein